MPRVRPPVLIALLLVGGLAIAATWLFSGFLVRGRLPAGDYEPHPAPVWEAPAGEAAAVREEALRRARVWREPAEPIEAADLSRNPGELRPLDGSALVCKFLPRPHSGTTPKFDCVLSGGEVIKVKYGGSAERHAEVAAARLLAALGFGADRMYLVPRIRCHGCPRNPFRTYQVLERARLDGVYSRWIDYAAYAEFEWVSVERRLPAPAIATPEVKGWAFHELDRIDPARGGATRAEVDALRLMAVFLHHWDNKPENQRLVCLAESGSGPRGACPEPLAMLQDVGSTFGPAKVSLAAWGSRPFWSDAATCALDMEDMPFGGATFRPVHVSEEGRRLLGDRLKRLSERQVGDLFTGARFAEYAPMEPGADVASWVRAFQRKVGEIADRPPCPALTSSDGPSRSRR
jgi:hypothetical protein